MKEGLQSIFCDKTKWSTYTPTAMARIFMHTARAGWKQINSGIVLPEHKNNDP